MSKLKKLNRNEVGYTCIKLISSLPELERTESNIERIFRVKGLIPPAKSTIYRCKKRIKQEEKNKIKDVSTKLDDEILESVNYIRIDDIESIKSIMSKIGIEDFKRIVSILS